MPKKNSCSQEEKEAETLRKALTSLHIKYQTRVENGDKAVSPDTLLSFMNKLLADLVESAKKWRHYYR